MTDTGPARYREIDTARGVALVMMLVSNFVTALTVFGLHQTQPYDFWWWLAKATAISFVFIAGLSAALGAARRRARGQPARAVGWSSLRRGGWIFAWGMVITVVTRVALGSTYIRWGVLHLIGFAIVASIPIVGRRWLCLWLGVAIGVWGLAIGSVEVDTSWWVWLGYLYPGFRTEDYFPVAPWFGVFLLGAAAGHALYPAGERAFRVAPSGHPAALALSWLGLHTLIIYLLHQPVFVAAFVLTGLVPLSWFTG